MDDPFDGLNPAVRDSLHSGLIELHERYRDEDGALYPGKRAMTFKALETRGLAKRDNHNGYRITPSGIELLGEIGFRAPNPFPPPEALTDNEASSSPADKTLSKPEGSDERKRLMSSEERWSRQLSPEEREAADHRCIYQQALTILALAYPEVNQLVDALDAIHRRAGK